MWRNAHRGSRVPGGRSPRGGAAGMARMLALLAACAFVPVCPRPAGAEVNIGVMVPSTGPQAEAGRAILNGAREAVERINAAGGVLGERLVPLIVDDGCGSASGQGAAEAVAAQRAALVIGHPCSSAAVAAAKVYARTSIPFIAIGSRAPELTDRRAGPAVFRLAGRDDAEAATAARHLAAHYRGRQIAILHDRTRFARSLSSALVAELTALGLPTPPVWGYVAGEKDYRALIAKVKEWQPAAIYIAGFPAEAAVLIRETRASGVAAAILGPQNLATAEFAALAGEAATDLLVTMPETALSLPAKALERSRSEAAAAVEAWAAAAAAASATHGSAVSAALGSGTFTTAIGALSFDAKGDARISTYALARWHPTGWQRAQ